MDDVKKYLFENRDELDVEKAPHPKVWQHIQQHAPVKKTWITVNMLKWAAAASVLIVAGAAASYLYWKQPAAPRVIVNDTTTTKTPEQAGRTDSSSITFSPYTSETPVAADSSDLPAASDELVKEDHRKSLPAKPKELTLADAVDQNYKPIIVRQLKRLEKTPIYAESPSYFNDLKKQWQDLEEDEKQVKADIDNIGLNDNVMAQLVRIYQQKLSLLKQLQHEINKMNNQVKKFPSFTEKQPSYLKL